jgi:riboflavin kinase/FMN adenylyltransferase
MRIEFGLPSERPALAPPAALSIGSFDGVHRGHRHVLACAAQATADEAGEVTLITFEPHPRCVVDPDNCPPSITTLDEKRERLEAAKVDRLVVVPFTRELSELAAAPFCERLCQAFALRHLVVGPDFALGYRRQGDVPFLRAFGAGHGFDVIVVPTVDDEQGRISSSRIRASLLSGEVEEAATLLGYPYFLDARVEHGERVGRRIGYPTANLAITPNKCLPARGVYTTWSKVRGCWYPGATNIGFRPTFGGDVMTVETYLLDFDDDIYREKIRTAFVHRLRDEIAYPDADALTEQIGRDVEETRALLGSAAPPEQL